MAILPLPAAELVAAVDADPPPLPLVLRAVAMPEDLGFLLALFGDSRAEEMALVPWPEAHKQAFLASQFSAQQADYHGKFAHHRFLVIERRGKPVGRLYLAATAPGMMRIVDLSVSAKAQGKGLGTMLLRWLAGLCAKAGAGLELHVRRGNRAQALYLRHGFVPVAPNGAYDLMRLPPRSPPPS